MKLEAKDVQDSPAGRPLTRRLWLAQAVCATSAFALPMPTWGSTAQRQGFWEQPRTIALKHLYGGEEIRITYWRDGEDIPSAYEELTHYWRDRKARRYYAVRPHPRVLDALYAYGSWTSVFGIKEPTRLHHGARDPLRRTEIEGAVRDSRHETGEAGDISHERVSSRKMAEFGLWLGVGSIGWYPSKHFTHVEASAVVRAWRGK